jgi:hypothetical protein
MRAQPESSSFIAKLTRALVASASTASREYRLVREEQMRASEADTDLTPQIATPGAAGLRKLASTAATELLYVGFLAALPATLIALFNFGAVYGHASWGAWLTISAGAILLVVGVLLASNVFDSREQLIAHLHPHDTRRKGRRPRMLTRLTATALKMVSVVWILLGLVALARGSSDLQ